MNDGRKHEIAGSETNDSLLLLTIDVASTSAYFSSGSLNPNSYRETWRGPSDTLTPSRLFQERYTELGIPKYFIVSSMQITFAPEGNTICLILGCYLYKYPWKDTP